ncbi:MAG: hypothetical protein EB054_06265 [Actinobacteria bacterium]|nr:hypothetical protein [Actinomycetota bacterium]
MRRLFGRQLLCLLGLHSAERCRWHRIDLGWVECFHGIGRKRANLCWLDFAESCRRQCVNLRGLEGSHGRRL